MTTNEMKIQQLINLIKKFRRNFDDHTGEAISIVVNN